MKRLRAKDVGLEYVVKESHEEVQDGRRVTVIDSAVITGASLVPDESLSPPLNSPVTALCALALIVICGWFFFRRPSLELGLGIAFGVFALAMEIRMRRELVRRAREHRR